MWPTADGEAVTSSDDVPDAAPGSTSNPIIAAQCCTGPGWNGGSPNPAVCRRRLNNNNADCLAGMGSSIVRHTYSQTFELCVSLGLQLCDFSCRGTGCWYNNHPVWSNVPCPAAP